MRNVKSPHVHLLAFDSRLRHPSRDARALSASKRAIEMGVIEPRALDCSVRYTKRATTTYPVIPAASLHGDRLRRSAARRTVVPS